jgi:DNA-binding NtrC family response regulator
MSTFERFGAGRPCLVVVPGGAPELEAALAQAGFAPVAAADERAALAALDETPFAAVHVSLALGLPAVSRIVAAAGQRAGDAPVTVLGVSGSVQEAVDAMQLGAADYLAPPCPPRTLLVRLGRALARPEPPPAEPFAAGRFGLIGASPAIRRVLDKIDRIARYKSNVLLLGESGTGKELIARALHERGPRRQHLFVPVNCATLGREILENELFGHERGAFTGANDRKRGLFELADGGTFFLDEIAEMDISTQAKLLRVLERSEFRRVGGTGKVKVDLSVIAATNRDLEEAIAAGRFREDLFYRLKVVTLVVPPLRERREDIPALVEAFVADFNRRTDGNVAGVASPALRWLVEAEWPGNVRELRNAVEGACVLATGDVVTLADFDHLPAPASRGPRAAARGPGAPRRERPDAADGRTRGDAAARVAEPSIAIPLGCTLAEAERRIVLASLHHHRTRARAAHALGIGLRTLYTKLAGWGAKAEDAETA